MDTGNGTTGFDRDFTVKGCIPSLGCERSFEQQIYTQSGLKVNELGFSFNGEGNDRLAITTSLMGATENPIDATAVDTLSTDLANGAVYNHFETKVVVLDQDEITEISRGTIKTFDLSLSNGTSYQYSLDGSPEAFKIDEGKIAISGNINVLFKAYANSFLTDAAAEILVPLKVYLRKGSEEVIFFIRDAKFEIISPAMSGDTSVEYSIAYNATDIEIIHSSVVTDDFTY
jgi:hypothetical protein